MLAMKRLASGINQHRQFIGGEWVNSTGKKFVAVENPATEETVARVPNGSVEDAERALEAARAAQPAWEALPPVERGNLLRRLAHLVVGV